MKYLVQLETDPKTLDPAGWKKRRAESPAMAAIGYLAEIRAVPTPGAIVTVAVAHDSPGNKHPNGTPLTVRVFAIEGSPK